MSTPTITQLQRAIVISEQIEKLQSELASIFGGREAVSAQPAKVAKVASKKGGKRTMSPEARERIAAAQRARWAKTKGDKAPVEAKAAAKPAKAKKKRNISPESRAKMAAAAKKRWADKKAVA